MQSAGIWLVDAGVSALYREGTKLAKGERYVRILRACWESHVGEVVCGCAPSAILIVGKGVESAIGDNVRQDLGPKIEVVSINQPNAHIFREDITRDRCACFDLCYHHRV